MNSMCTASKICGVILLLSVASSAFILSESQSRSDGLIETPCPTRAPSSLKCFELDGQRIVVPNIALDTPERVDVREDPLSNGFYFAVPLVIGTDVSFPEESSSANWNVLRVNSFDVQLRQAACLTECSKVSVSSEWASGGVPLVRFHCSSRATCLRVLWTLQYSGADNDRLRSSLQFRFIGQVNDRRYTLSRTGLPVLGHRSQNISTSPFWFESEKVLLFSVAANSGHEVAATFLNSGIQHPVPSSGVIPTVFRSALIDKMSQLHGLTGMRYIVAEMRARGRMVSQVVLDISVRTAHLNKESWFARDRVVSSHPYPVGDAGQGSPATGNYFSITGDNRTPEPLKRTFLIGFVYGGCPKDTVFWAVNEVRDVCEWAHRNWGGLPPSLVYTTGRAWVHGTEGDVFRYDADQFLVYLM